MYPIKFKSLYYEKIWGGRDFELFRQDLPEGKIGESWDVACHPNGTSIVANGEFEGLDLNQLIRLKGEEILGTKIPTDPFPLLVKLINAKDNLSVQVHPNDQYAKEVEGELGKTEVWYVIEAEEGATLVAGTKEGMTKEAFKEALESGNCDQYLNSMPVKKGDVVFVKSGLIHAIGKGVTIAEIQQNSDTTYRVYDYNRGRELHVEQALKVTNLNLKGRKNKGIKIEKEGYIKTYLCLVKEFSLERYEVLEEVKEVSDHERFHIITCVEGQGEVIYQSGSMIISKGDSILIPASLGAYEIQGQLCYLKSYVPDIHQVSKEILKEIIL